MEFLSQDPEIGPELVALLGEKLKKAREAVDALEKDNQKLREEARDMRTRTIEPKQEPGLNVIHPDAICRAGICSSIDQVKTLSNELRTLHIQKKKDVEEFQTSFNALRTQKEQEAQAFHAEISSLHERLERTKTKYYDCKAKLKDCRKELETSIENRRLEEMTPARRRIEDEDQDEGGTEDQGHGDDKETEDGKMPSEREEANRYTALEYEMHGSPEREHLTREKRWKQLASVACFPSHIQDPSSFPLKIRKISQHGFLFIPGCTVFHQAQDHACIYLPAERCSPDIDLIWSKNTQFARHKDTTRDLFYAQEGLLWYAGSFKCSSESDISQEDYRNLHRSIKGNIIKWTFTIPLESVTSQDQNDRVGFNQELYDAMMQHGSQSSAGGSRKTSQKRKACSQKPGASWKKQKRS